MKITKEPYQLNPDDIMNDVIARRVITMIFYEGVKIEKCAKALFLTEEKIYRFMDALNTDRDMQKKYSMNQLLFGKLSAMMQSSFGKVTPYHHDEMMYGEMMPKEYLKLGWFAKEGF